MEGKIREREEKGEWIRGSEGGEKRVKTAR